MSWHIFKKDARLMWWFAAVVAGLRIAEVAVAQSAGLFPPVSARNLTMLLGMVGILSVGFAICAVVHQDAIPGVRQDWLVRPIRRRDLLLSKFIFVVLFLQMPIFLADFIQGLLTGAGVSTSLASAASRSMFLLLTVDIPFLALASLTRNLLEALTAAVGICVAFVAFGMLFLNDPGRRFQPVFGTGLEWIGAASLAIVMLIGASALLGLQFFRRWTLLSRWLMGGFTILSILATFVPWTPAFAIQRALTAAAGSSSAITIEFLPGPVPSRGPAAIGNDSFQPAFLPMRISGLASDYAVHSDRIEFAITDTSGRRYKFGIASSLSVQGDAVNQEHHVTQMIAIPSDLYRTIGGQPVRLDIVYSLTLFKLAASHTLPALNAREYLPDAGQCGTRLNAPRTGIQLSCQQTGRAPGCMALRLEDPSTGDANPGNFNCERTDYGPFPNWQLLPDGLARTGGGLPFRDVNGLAKYPVDDSKLGESRIAIRIYEPVEHFTRTQQIPQIKLNDWEVAPYEGGMATHDAGVVTPKLN
jgi:hypothetical protein